MVEQGYGEMLGEIKSRIRAAQHEALRAVNKELLCHRRLKCLVALELKTGAFLPEYLGRMQFYLAVLDDTVRMPDENPALGIILCKSKDRTIVEYALRESSKPVGVATCRMVPALPAEYAGQMPTPEQVAGLLEGVSG